MLSSSRGQGNFRGLEASRPRQRTSKCVLEDSTSGDYDQKPNQIKSYLSLCSLYYAEACIKFAGPISASLRPGNTASFEEMSQRWRAVGNSESNLIGPRFESQTSSSRNERVTAWPTSLKVLFFVLQARSVHTLVQSLYFSTNTN